MSCPTCHGERWTCEYHPLLPVNHDDLSSGAGAPCPESRLSDSRRETGTAARLDLDCRRAGGSRDPAKLSALRGSEMTCWVETDRDETHIYSLRAARPHSQYPPDDYIRQEPQ